MNDTIKYERFKLLETLAPHFNSMTIKFKKSQEIIT